jgi:CHASE2 domain-containing sensor protein
MLLDNIMPLYHFNEVQSIIVRSNTRSSVLNAVRDIRPKEIPFLFELFWLRGLPSFIILRKRYKFSINRKRPLLEQFLASGFILLYTDRERIYLDRFEAPAI